MLDLKQTYAQANKLMESAVAKYSSGDFTGGDKDRDSANKLYDEAKNTLMSESAKNDILYGEGRGFGVIYKVIEENTVNMFKKKGENKKLAEIVKYIKENKTLMNEMNTLKALMYPENVKDAENYVNEALSIIPSLDKKEVFEENEKLISKMRELGINEMIDIKDDDMELFEAVDYLMSNRKSFSNLNEYVDKKKVVVEHVRNVCENESKKADKKIDEVYDSLKKSISEKYEGLNDDEKALMEKVNETDDKEGLFEETKKEALKMLQERYNSCTTENKEKIDGIISLINERKFNESTICADVAEMIEIRNTLAD